MSLVNPDLTPPASNPTASRLLRRASPKWADTLDAAISATDTTLTLTNGTDLSTDSAVTLVIDPGTVKEEVVLGFPEGSNIVNMYRHVEGATIGHDAGATVMMRSTAIDHNALVDFLRLAHDVDTGQVETAGIEDAAVTAAKLASNAVTTAKITDSNVTNAKLATGIDASKLYNSSKFSAYLFPTQTFTSTATVLFQNEEFDTGGGYNPATGRFTPSVNGYYQINASVSITLDNHNAVAFGHAMNRNGTAVVADVDVNMYAGAYNHQTSTSALLYLTTSDYVDITAIGYGAGPGSTVTSGRFSGFLVSTT